MAEKKSDDELSNNNSQIEKSITTLHSTALSANRDGYTHKHTLKQEDILIINVDQKPSDILYKLSYILYQDIIIKCYRYFRNGKASFQVIPQFVDSESPIPIALSILNNVFPELDISETASLYERYTLTGYYKKNTTQ